MKKAKKTKKKTRAERKLRKREEKMSIRETEKKFVAVVVDAAQKFQDSHGVDDQEKAAFIEASLADDVPALVLGKVSLLRFSPFCFVIKDGETYRFPGNRLPAWFPFVKVTDNVENFTYSDAEMWNNSRYMVSKEKSQTGWVDEDGEKIVVDYLSIKRLDRGPIHDWRDLQRIKNEICGPEREALEIYPAESRLVDTANQYHLFVLPEGMKLPLGMDQRVVAKGGSRLTPEGFTSQRPFEPGATPPDAVEWDEIRDMSVGAQEKWKEAQEKLEEVHSRPTLEEEEIERILDLYREDAKAIEEDAERPAEAQEEGFFFRVIHALQSIKDRGLEPDETVGEIFQVLDRLGYKRVLVERAPSGEAQVDEVEEDNTTTPEAETSGEN